MLLDPQNQFREDVMKPQVEGKSFELPPGYEELYEEWAKANSETLYRMSAEERTQSFSDFVWDNLQPDIKHLAKTKEQKEFAIRGQALLASSDGGKTFDQLITPEDIPNVTATDYVLLTPSFRSATVNLREAMDEQSVVHVTTKLRQQHFLVNRASIQDHRIVVDVTHPRTGMYTVQVELDQPITVPIVYEFISAGKVTRVPETQLPEEFGMPREEPTLAVPPEETLITAEILRQAPEAPISPALQATLAAMAATQGITIAEAAQKAASQVRGEEAARLARAQMQAPLVPLVVPKGAKIGLPSIIVSKAAMAARMARQAKEVAESQKAYIERIESAKKAQEEFAKQRRAQEAAIAAEQRGKGAGLLKSSLVGTGLVGGLLGSLAGLSSFLTNINLLT